MKPHVKFGLIAAVSGILWNLIMFVTDLEKSDLAKPLGYVVIILFIVFIVLAIKEHRDNNKGFITFGEAFKTGFLTVLIASTISIAYFYLHTTIIDPGYIDNIMEKTQQEMNKQPNMTEEQIAQAMKYTAMFLTPVMMCVFGFFANLFGGAIASLIISAIMKKDPPPGEITIQ